MHDLIDKEVFRMTILVTALLLLITGCSRQEQPQGNIIPTGSRGRKRKEAPEPDERMEELEKALSYYQERSRELETQVTLLQEKARKLEKDKSQLAAGIKELLERYQ